MKKSMTKNIIVAASMLLAGGVWAATDTANLAVGATVVNVCAIGPGT